MFHEKFKIIITYPHLELQRFNLAKKNPKKCGMNAMHIQHAVFFRNIHVRKNFRSKNAPI
jgi:hypothetical protein